MSTVAEISAALPQLSTSELLAVERALHAVYRQRKDAIVYDDAHGMVTEEDMVAAAEQAFLEYDKEEQRDAGRKAG